MIRLAYKVWAYLQSDKLGGWLPMPIWLRKYLSRLPLQKRIYTYARILIGTDVSTTVNNSIACAETVSRILMELGILDRVITGTYTFFEYLSTSGRFMKVQIPQAGDIIVSPTGLGNGKLPNGHIGIVEMNNRIISNDSSSGKIKSNYTLTTWNSFYKSYGGYPVYFYRIIK